jgi:hypothetical protein
MEDQRRIAGLRLLGRTFVEVAEIESASITGESTGM